MELATTVEARVREQTRGPAPPSSTLLAQPVNQPGRILEADFCNAPGTADVKKC